MAAVEVGVGYVSVVPSARGFAEALQRQIGRPTIQVGAEVGEQAGQAASRGMLSSLGTGLKAGLAAVAVAGAAVFTAAFAQAVEQNKSNAKLAAQLGLDPKQAQRLGKIAGSVYAKGYGESIDQINDSLRTLAQNGVIAANAPQKDIEALTKSATNLAEAFDVEVGDAARAAGQLIRTSMVKDAREAFDLITVGFQSGADKGQDFLDTLNEYGTQFRKAGLDGSAAVGLITQALQAGARDGDVAADAIKEFSIRAVDGSETSAEGFKALGLNALTMGQQFAQGGSAANAVLDTTLDRLRAVKDPVQQSQIAVALFGTQAEDLGQSLLAMDPSSATAALGKVGGAADRMGAALHDTATNDFEVFKRQAMQSIVAVIDREVLPVIAKVGTQLLAGLPSALATVSGALQAVGSAFAAGVNWLREYGAWLLPLGVAVAGLTITLNASAIATAAVTAVFSVYRGVILAAAAVTRGYAVVQGLLNAVMSANPIGLIITGIAALVTLLVVAYQKSDTFRAIVQAAWAGIQAGWSVLWNSVLKPGFDALMIAVQAIGAAAAWLWNTILSPVFSAIGLAARVLFAILATILIAPLMILFNALGALAGWLWDAAIKPAFDAIGAAGAWLWNSVLKPAFDAIGAGAMWLWNNGIKPAFDQARLIFQALGVIASWLWNSVIGPVFRWIGDKAMWLWTNGVKPAFEAFKLGLQTLGDKGKWLWTNIIQPVFGWIGDKASWLYDKAIKPAFDNVKRAIALVSVAFDVAKVAIGKAWDKVADLAKKPVNFILEWVYTKGIKKVWDGVAGFVGLDPLPAAPKLLAAGGTVGPGWGPAAPMQVNRPTAIVGEGNPNHPEYVIPTDPKYRGRALSLWQAAGTQLMADGGIIGGAVDWLGGAAKKIGGAVMSGVDFLSDPSKMWEKATAFLRSKIAEIGQSGLAQMLAKIPVKMLGGLKDKIISAAKNLFGGGSSADIGGSGVQRWSPVVLQALRMVGQPASLLPVVLRRMNQESGGNPAAINNWDINAKNGTPSKGLMQVIDPTFNAYAGALRGRGVWDPLANIYASMRYAMSRYGSLASAYNRPGGYANGGRPKRGELAWVGERGPELVRFGSGDTEVFDHERSMRMAAGLGTLRGFAKGTPGKRAVRAEPPKLKLTDLSAFTRSLTGSASAIGTAAKQLVMRLRLAGGAGAKLASQVSKVTAQLQGLAAKRDKVAATIATAREAAADQRQTAADFLGLSNQSSAGSAADLITGMEMQQDKLRKFQSTITSLATRGLNQDAIRQLVDMGPDSSLAKVIAGGTAADIRRINELTKSGGTLAGTFGNAMADAMYDSGKDAGKGFLTGLLSQQRDLQAAMTRLGANLLQDIKVGMGLASARPRAVAHAPATRATARIAQVATPVRRTVEAPPGPRPPAAGGLQAGDRIALRVGDRELDAYVERVVVDTLVPAAQAISGRK
ncbi:phage tail tape measure protein [Streptomyces sp. NPDC127166]|uniref:phage tail tape measure protein n=1 Tax=Streptomyces sp. NPDC127166 TaxID=3345380 RepID=UPI00362FCC95